MSELNDLIDELEMNKRIDLGKIGIIKLIGEKIVLDNPAMISNGNKFLSAEDTKRLIERFIYLKNNPVPVSGGGKSSNGDYKTFSKLKKLVK